MKKVQPPFSKKVLRSFKAGEELLLSGTIYTARDLAHQRLLERINNGIGLPAYLKNGVIYYCGPTPAPKGKAIGSCGPTTSSRMDAFTPALLKEGLGGMIGKGQRGPAVKAAIKKYGAVYFLAIGGAGALLAGKVRKARPVAYQGLGPEAVYELEVEDFPLIVGIDSKGKDVFQMAA